ncbi:MAG: L,D-transpeptidase family protein [Planctomycetota bacterium]
MIAVLSAIAVIVFRARPQISPGQLYSKPLDKPLAEPKIVVDKSKRLVEPKIVVDKSKRRLFLYSDSKIVRSYRIVLGFQPTGDKVEEGDGRTPEGRYYVCVKNPKSQYYLSLGLSYPNIQDAERGLRGGLISRQQYRRIAEAISQGRQPPWHTPLGGEIFIHGDGSKRDWTLGCIALNNDDMRELYDVVSVGTPVLIQASTMRARGHTSVDAR